MGKEDRMVYRALPAEGEARFGSKGNVFVDLQPTGGQSQFYQGGEEELGVKVMFKRGWGKRAVEARTYEGHQRKFSVPQGLVLRYPSQYAILKINSETDD